MAKKKRACRGKGNTVWKQSAEEATLAQKPHYNGFACGHGAHGPTKYDRNRSKRQWKAQLRQEGASRGSFLFLLAHRRRCLLFSLSPWKCLMRSSRVPSARTSNLGTPPSKYRTATHSTPSH